MSVNATPLSGPTVKRLVQVSVSLVVSRFRFGKTEFLAYIRFFARVRGASDGSHVPRPGPSEDAVRADVYTR